MLDEAQTRLERVEDIPKVKIDVSICRCMIESQVFEKKDKKRIPWKNYGY